MILLEKIEVTSPTSSVTFSNIPDVEQDLFIHFSLNRDTTEPLQSANIKFNSSSSTYNYGAYAFSSDDSSTSDTKIKIMQYLSGTESSSIFLNGTMWIVSPSLVKKTGFTLHSYYPSDSTTGKAAGFLRSAGHYTASEKITSITVDGGGQNLGVNSVVRLYQTGLVEE